MHPDTEQIQRLLHDELAAPVAASVRAHVSGCPECQTRVAEAEREEAHVLDLLGALDHAPPRVRASDIVARSGERGRGARLRRLAAGVALALAAAGAAYALPGSPVPAWLRRAATWMDQSVRGARTPPLELAPVEGDIPQGIAVAPGARFVIAFSAHQADGAAILSITDSADVIVRASGGRATFTSEIDRLAIGNEGSTATFRIQLPRRAPRVEVLVTGRRIFLKEDSRVLTDAPRDSGGRYLLSLSPPPR